MGLFGFKKKDPLPDYSKTLGTQGTNDFNNFGLEQQNYGLPPSSDQNSGLKLADLNSQNMGFGQQETGGADSFGNPRIQQRTENYEYGKQQQYNAPQDNSKDLQLILSKLDTIKSEITNINHRLDNIERQQKEPQQKKYPW